MSVETMGSSRGVDEGPTAEVFPEDFIWGVATSAIQIEGARDVDGRGASIWDTFAAQPGSIEDGSTSEVACDHYHRFDEDVEIIRSLGLGAYRFSVSWPRVFPEGAGTVNERGLDFYERLVDSLLGAGIEPWLTLYHWDLPQALEDRGGWTCRSVAEAFTRFADAVSRRLGDRVQNWITHNEPWCASVLGYAQGEHAPGRKSWADALAAAHHLLLSHGWAVPVIRRNSPGARVGITLNTSQCEPASPSQADCDAARRFDGELNRWFLDPLYFGRYPDDVIEAHTRSGHLAAGMHFVRPGDLEAMSVPTDFLGINYYSRSVVRSDEIPEGRNEERTIPMPDPKNVTDMGWEVYPVGLKESLVRIHADYAPSSLVITENGAAYGTGPGADGRVRDFERCDYMRRHLRACLDAIDAGVPLNGYFLWSLLDNFEWAFGYSKRFGIVWVDFETQRRVVKESARLYSRIARKGGFQEEKAA